MMLAAQASPQVGQLVCEGENAKDMPDKALFGSTSGTSIARAFAQLTNPKSDRSGHSLITMIKEYDPEQDSLGVVVNHSNKDMKITLVDVGNDVIVKGDGTALARVVGAAGKITTANIAILTESTPAKMLGQDM